LKRRSLMAAISHIAAGDEPAYALQSVCPGL
jgi:hypothetical protein